MENHETKKSKTVVDKTDKKAKKEYTQDDIEYAMKKVGVKPPKKAKSRAPHDSKIIAYIRDEHRIVTPTEVFEHLQKQNVDMSGILNKKGKTDYFNDRVWHISKKPNSGVTHWKAQGGYINTDDYNKIQDELAKV